MRWCVHHEQEALLGGGKLRNVVLGVGSSDMLHYGAVPLVLSWHQQLPLACFDSVRACELHGGGQLQHEATWR